MTNLQHFLKKIIPRPFAHDSGYEPIPNADHDPSTASIIAENRRRRNDEDDGGRVRRPMYLSAKSSSLNLGTAAAGGTRIKKKRSAIGLGLAAGILTLWILSILCRESLRASTEKVPFVVPGDASWLCRSGGNNNDVEEDVCAPGDGTPEYEPYFPIVYILLGDDEKVIARAIVNHTTPCPRIQFKRGDGDQRVISQQHKVPPVLERGVGNDILPYAFPVRVCEAYIERNQTNLYFGDKRLPTVHHDPTRYVVLGDTGLRSKPSNLGLGTCEADGLVSYGIHQCVRNFTQDDIDVDAFAGHFQSLTDWPLRTLMRNAVNEERPDVLVHMGDFIYRQGPCPYPNDNDNATCSGINLPNRYNFTGSDRKDLIMNFVPGSYGDNWSSWWADFFYPSLDALASVPWIALRGNHESCARAGRGWFLFLSSQPYGDPDADADVVGGSYCQDHTEPRRISFRNEQFLLMDDSTIEPKDHGFDGLRFVPGDCPAESGANLPIPQVMNRFHATNPPQDCDNIYHELDLFTLYFQTVERMSQSSFHGDGRRKSSFYLGHRPIFGIACNDTQLLSMDWTLQCSLSCTTLDRISALFSGHMHWKESITFQDDRLPPQIIVGHGGTDLVSNYILDRSLDGLKLEVGRGSMIEATIDEGEPDASAFGYAVMDRRESNNYKVVFRGLNMTNGKMKRTGTPLFIPQGPRKGEATVCQEKENSLACSPPKGHRCHR